MIGNLLLAGVLWAIGYVGIQVLIFFKNTASKLWITAFWSSVIVFTVGITLWVIHMINILNNE